MKPLSGIVAIVAVLIISGFLFIGTQFSVENAPSTKGTAIITGAALFIVFALIRGMHEEPAQTPARNKTNKHRHAKRR